MSDVERTLLEKLSPAEKRALQLKGHGHTRASAAVEMGVGRDHVKNLWQRIRRKARALGLPIFGQLPGSSARLSRLSRIDLT